MPEKKAKQEAARRKRQGKSPSSQAGEFVHQEIRHVREGKHGARSPQQAIAIGLAKARRAGVKLPPPKRGSARTKASAAAATRAGRHRGRRVSPKRSRAAKRTLRRERHDSASHKALARQAKTASRRRGAADRARAARKAARTRARRD